MIKAFVGHSFEEKDKETITKFKEYFDSLTKSMDFQWDDAQEPQIMSLSDKVKEKMEGKNLFIGIITKKHIEVEENAIIKPKIFHKDKCTARKTDCKWGVSYWMIQESGYAIAKGMKILFLIERGVRELPGLHGDDEYIPFSKDKESNCFPDLNKALGNLLKDIKGISNKPKTEELIHIPKEEKEKTIKEEIIEQKATEQEKKEMTEEDYFNGIFLSLYKKNKDEFEKLKEEVLTKFKTNAEKLTKWRGQILHLEGKLANKNVLKELIELKKEDSNNPLILFWIGNELEKYGDYDAAAIEYLESAKLEKNRETQLLRIGYASEAYANNKNREEALRILFEELKGNLSKEEQFQIYKYLSDTAKILKDNELFVVFAEKSLSLDPSNDALRFDLAYKYDDIGSTELALYHYKLLTKNNPASANLNNIAVAYEKLDMPGKAVKFYKEAVEHDSTIAMANLAQQYLKGGFINEANDQLKKATEYKEYEKDNVGRALARIDSIIDNEDKKEKEILENIEEERQFKLDYAEAYSISFPINDSIKGKWESKHGLFDLTFESGNMLSGNGEEAMPETPLPSLLGLALASGTILGESSQKKISSRKKVIKFNGRVIRNRVIEYNIKIEIQSSNQYASSVAEYSGYGVVNKEMNIIKVTEKDKENKITIYTLARK